MHLSLAFNNLKQSQKNIILSKSYDMAKSEISLSSCMAARPQVTDILTAFAVGPGGLSCVPMKLSPPSSLCTSEVRWGLGGDFFALFVPPGSTAVGSGGMFALF